MRKGLQITLERFLPLPALARLAVDYANLNPGAGPLDVRRFAKDWYANHDRKRGFDVSALSELPPGSDKVLEQPDTREWVRALMECAASHKRLSEDADTELAEMIAAQRPRLDVWFVSGKLGGSLEARQFKLHWLVAIGCASLVPGGYDPFKGMVRRCDNFDGPKHKTQEMKYCENYVLLLSDGGRRPSRFCSSECRNRVHQRKIARAKAAANRARKLLRSSPRVSA